MRSAVKPDHFVDFNEVVKKVEAEPDQLSIDEKLLHHLYTHEGWKVLERFIDELKTQVETVSNVAIENGANFEEIGKNAVIVKLVQKYLDLVVQKTKDAYESVESQPKPGK